MRVKVVIDSDYGNYIPWIEEFKFTVIRPRNYSVILDFDRGEFDRHGFYSLVIGDKNDICLYGDVLSYSMWDGHRFVYMEEPYNK